MKAKWKRVRTKEREKKNEMWRCFGSFESLMLLGGEGKNTHSTANSIEDDEKNRKEEKYYIANNK